MYVVKIVGYLFVKPTRDGNTNNNMSYQNTVILSSQTLIIFLSLIFIPDEDLSEHFTSRSALFDTLASFFPEEMTQPRGNLIDLITIQWHERLAHDQYSHRPAVNCDIVFCKLSVPVIKPHVMLPVLVDVRLHNARAYYHNFLSWQFYFYFKAWGCWQNILLLMVVVHIEN